MLIPSPTLSIAVGHRMNHRLFPGFWAIVLTICLAFGVRSEGASDGVGALIQLLQKSSDPALRLDVLRGIKAGLVGRRGLSMPEGWLALESKLAKDPNPEVQRLTQSIGLSFGSEWALNELRTTLQDSKRDLEDRRAALESLASVKDPQLPVALRKVLVEPGIRPSALRALASFSDAETPEAILGVYSQLNVSERRDALNTLASRLSFAKPLDLALRQGRVPPSHLTAELVRQLRSLKDPEINADLAKLWGVSRETSPDKRSEIDKYRKIYAAGGSTQGDASRGRKVFTRVCQQCHTLFDVGGKVGPDLTGSNRADLDYILSNIVDPNAVIPNDYRSSTIEMKDDRILTGIVKQQDDKTVTIVTANETIVSPRSDIKSIQLSELSMMPEGLLAQLTDQEIRDLIYYLGRPGQVP